MGQYVCNLILVFGKDFTINSLASPVRMVKQVWLWTHEQSKMTPCYGHTAIYKYAGHGGDAKT